jgi:hypothetical protein
MREGNAASREFRAGNIFNTQPVGFVFAFRMAVVVLQRWEMA